MTIEPITALDAPRTRTLVIYGAGGHGLVVAEAAVAAGWTVLGFVDDDDSRKSAGLWSMLDDSVLQARGGQVNVIVAIGDNDARQKLTDDLHHQGCKLVTIAHPLAWISPSANIGPGVFIAAGAAVQAEAHIDRGAIINTGAIVEHHGTIGQFTHIAPGVTLGGRVHIGSLTLIGIGATHLHEIRIGNHCTFDIGDGQTVMGVPARGK